jgi:broad specificity phosphatase PhoE
MSSLTLVRHAQASFFADDYDELSLIGQRQARELGEYWAKHRAILQEAYMGPRRRHQQTAAFAAKAYQEAGLTFPEPSILSELDEYDLEGILQHLAPQLARKDETFAILLEQQRSGETPHDQARNFQRMFEPLLIHWISVGETAENVETWPAFCERVQCGLRRIVDQPGRGRHVVAFTSGGFIAAAMQFILGVTDRTALEINWRILNTALTEFVFTGDRTTLDAFNSIAHLTKPELKTYR